MNKLKIITDFYCDLFDSEKMNSTVLVGIIGLLMVCVGVMFRTPGTNAYLKGNLLELPTKNIEKNIVEIDGKKYELILNEVIE